MLQKVITHVHIKQKTVQYSALEKANIEPQRNFVTMKDAEQKGWFNYLGG